MKSCCKCGKEVSSGFVVCNECSEKTAIPLRYYIDQLAEEIVLDHPDTMCFLDIWADTHPITFKEGE